MSWIHSDKDFVLDSHCDTPTMLLEEIDLGKRQPRGHVDFVRAREGGVDGMFFAIYSPPELTDAEATVHAIRLISKCYDAVDSNSAVAAFAFIIGLECVISRSAIIGTTRSATRACP